MGNILLGGLDRILHCYNSGRVRNRLQMASYVGGSNANGYVYLKRYSGFDGNFWRVFLRLTGKCKAGHAECWGPSLMFLFALSWEAQPLLGPTGAVRCE